MPVTVNVTAGSPADTVGGEKLLAPGTGLLIVNVVTSEGLPPVFDTVTKGVPATAIALAGIAACNWVESLYVAETWPDLNVTTELDVNPVPVRIRVNAGPPAVALAGTSAPITGCVLLGRIVKVNEDVIPPALPGATGFVTEMESAP